MKLRGSRSGWLVILILSILLAGCYTNKQRRGKLSDAMAGASKSKKEERKVKTKPVKRAVHHDSTRVIPGQDSLYISRKKAFINIETGSKVSKPALGFITGTGLLKSEDFYGLSDFILSYESFNGQYWRADIQLGTTYAPIQTTGLLNESLKDGVLIVHLGIQANRFTTPMHTFLGQYFYFGFKINAMMWSYKNPIIVDEYDDFGIVIGEEEISHDVLIGFDLNLGIGLNLIQTHYLTLGGECSPGVVLWANETEEGFDNDIFSSFLYIKLKLCVKLGLSSY